MTFAEVKCFSFTQVACSFVVSRNYKNISIQLCCYFLLLEMKCFFLRKGNLPKFKRKIRYSNMIKRDEVHVMKNNTP